MEKRTPQYPLLIVRKLMQEGKVRSTFSALAGGAALGLNLDDMVAVILNLTPRDFYKSMTTYADDRIWQDVYRPSTSVGEVYLKLTVVEDVLIVSFKEL